MGNQKRIDEQSELFAQHLRSFRPRSPKVNAPELQTLNTAADQQASHIKREDGSFFVSRFWFTVAASWLCGTLIGAGAMYFLLEKSRPVVAAGDDAPQTVKSIPEASSWQVTGKQDDKLFDDELINQSIQSVPAPKATYPDLISFAQQTLVLRAGANFAAIEAPRGPSRRDKGSSRSAKNTTIDASSYETVSKVMREIQLPADSVSTRSSLIKDLLEIY